MKERRRRSEEAKEELEDGESGEEEAWGKDGEAKEKQGRDEKDTAVKE